MHTDFEYFNTLLVHVTANQTGAIGPAVIPSAAFGYEGAELVRETFARFGVKNSFCEVDDFETIEAKLRDGVKMVLFESVGNPSLTLPDISRILTLCKAYQTLSLIDNTATPLLVRPLELGADIVMHSTTKNISGFAGPLGGAVVFRAVHCG